MTFHHYGFFKMILLLIVFSCLLTARTVEGSGERKRCLTGSMTDIQSWVDENGHLTSGVDKKSSLDMSGTLNPSSVIEHFISKHSATAANRFKYLSMARCGLIKIPTVFKFRDRHNQALAETLEYITFYGNNFSMLYRDNVEYDVGINITATEEEDSESVNRIKNLSAWGTGFRDINFKKLRELDLRACYIQSLGADTFCQMPNLTRIYLSENRIFYIEADAFSKLTNLRHLDLSRNYPLVGVNRSVIFDFAAITGSKLESLDLSFSQFGQRNIQLLGRLENLRRLSLCYAGITRLRARFFKRTSLRFLDVSGNNDILQSRSVLRGLEFKLQVLYAEEVGLINMDCLFNLTVLEIAKLRRNEIAAVPQNVAETLKSLQVLDLSYNRVISWFTRVVSLMPNLKLLLLQSNKINMVSNDMFNDLQNVSYVGLSNNFLVCSCNVRYIYEISYNNEFSTEHPLITFNNKDFDDDYISFHNGLKDFNEIILDRRNSTEYWRNNSTIERSDVVQNGGFHGKYVLLIDDDYIDSFRCLLPSEGKVTFVDRIRGCSMMKRELDLYENVKREWNKFFLLIIPVVVLLKLLFIYMYRKNLRYFLITIKNTTMLSLINRDDFPSDATIFHYDAFISYCNEDRGWVLDHFLPHVERECNISVCLHERDFQVGLSILENIVSCMDRSRSIVLIISKRFLLSQWCQFEMHLAQHRLLETRREDLILVLLEEIPRRLRPNTLHYLMLTKTYIVWPNEESGQALFWKRMKKSIVTLKLKHSENISLA